MENKRKKSKIIRIIISLICLCLVIVSSYKIINWYQDTNKSKEIKEEINKYVEKKDTEYKIDFKELQKKNSDTVAYLKVNNTNINYVVVKGKDNDYYLHHDFKKNNNITGWVFATYQNKMNGTDKNIVIFGHNMRDGSMFGTMKKVLNKKWYNNEKNLTIELATKTGTYKYKVFSIYQIEPEDYYINTDFYSNLEYERFLKTIKSRSIKDFKVDLNKKDTILTLSTCSMTGRERVVLHAKKI